MYMGKEGFSEGLFMGSIICSSADRGRLAGRWEKLPSIWDIAKPKQIKHGENCHESCDHYHHWKEDVALMKKMGLKAYRFSISWSRVIPEEGKINQRESILFGFGG